MSLLELDEELDHGSASGEGNPNYPDDPNRTKDGGLGYFLLKTSPIIARLDSEDIIGTPKVIYKANDHISYQLMMAYGADILVYTRYKEISAQRVSYKEWLNARVDDSLVGEIYSEIAEGIFNNNF